MNNILIEIEYNVLVMEEGRISAAWSGIGGEQCAGGKGN